MNLKIRQKIHFSKANKKHLAETKYGHRVFRDMIQNHTIKNEGVSSSVDAGFFLFLFFCCFFFVFE